MWFAAAADAGLAEELEALAIHKALDVVPDLPADTFLTVNVSPHILGSSPVQDALAGRPDLNRVVVELTEHTPVHDLTALRRQCDELRERGASSPWTTPAAATRGCSSSPPCGPRSSSWTAPWSATPTPTRSAWRWPRCWASSPAGSTPGCWPRAWRPQRNWPRSPASASRWVRAGCSAARPRTFQPLAPDVVALVRAQVARARLTDSVASLLRPVRQTGERAATLPAVVLVGPHGEPLALVLADPRTAEVYTAPVSLRVHPSADVAETLQRALTRPPAQRFDPVLCTDPRRDGARRCCASRTLPRAATASPLTRPQTPVATGSRPHDRRPAPHDKESTMKTFACGDVVPGCSARFSAADEDGIFARSPATPPPTTASPTSRRSWCRRSAAASSRLSTGAGGATAASPALLRPLKPRRR